MTKICLIRQPAGLGDILYCLKIAKTIQQTTDYKKIIWPVSNVYSYLNQYLVSNDIDFCNEDSYFPYRDIYLSENKNIIKTENLLYLPLQSVSRSSCECHPDVFTSRVNGHIKYNFCKIQYDDWFDYFDINRDYLREEDLFKSLKLDSTEPYNVINKNYGTFPHFLSRSDIEVNNGFKNIYMNFYKNVNIFDWIKVFECAAEIHTVETAVVYLLEKLGLKNVCVYSRHPDKQEDFTAMQSKHTTTWRYVC